MNGCPITSSLGVQSCPHPICCDDITPTLVPSDPGVATLAVALGAGSQQATTVRATVLGAWHTSNGCVATGPLTATASQSQPQPPSGWTGPSVPFVNGTQIVWSSAGAPLGTTPFPMRWDLVPGTGSVNCNDTVTIVVEFEVIFAATPTRPCHTCTAIRTFTFGRCPLCQ